MADYADVISSVLGKFSDKVKEYTDGKSAKEIYDSGIEKVSNYGKRAKLLLDIAGAREELNGVYNEVGKLYYDKTLGSPDEGFEELFSQISQLREEIVQKQTLADSYVDTSAKETVDADITQFEDIVDKSEN